MDVKLIDFDIKADNRGSLVALESNKNIPFEIKRVYYIFGTSKKVQRGFHAHIQLQQVAICIQGKCKILLDNGTTRRVIELNKPNKGLFIDKMIWRVMYDFSYDSVLMVLASELYDESDYIRNYDKYISLIK